MSGGPAGSRKRLNTYIYFLPCKNLLPAALPLVTLGSRKGFPAHLGEFHVRQQAPPHESENCPQANCLHPRFAGPVLAQGGGAYCTECVLLWHWHGSGPVHERH